MLQTLDLNLLRVFDALMEEGSATRVGARLGLSQSAVSHALNRLRHALGDDLFVRSSQGMTPTARARELGPRIHAALAQLQIALSPADFDPATTERRFVIVAGAYVGAVLIPTLVQRLAERAPHAELVITDAATDLLDQLDSRRADFLVGVAARTPERLAQELLFRETLAWMVNSDHPLASKTNVGLEDLVQTPHVVIARDRAETPADGPLVMRTSREAFGALETELQARGLHRRVGVTVPDAYSAMAVVRRTQMAALIPRRLADLTSRGGYLTLIEPPHESSAIDMGLIYLRDRLNEPAMVWMRDLMRQVAREV